MTGLGHNELNQLAEKKTMHKAFYVCLHQSATAFFWILCFQWFLLQFLFLLFFLFLTLRGRSNWICKYLTHAQNIWISYSIVYTAACTTLVDNTKLLYITSTLCYLGSCLQQCTDMPNWIFFCSFYISKTTNCGNRTPHCCTYVQHAITLQILFKRAYTMLNKKHTKVCYR